MKIKIFLFNKLVLGYNISSIVFDNVCVFDLNGYVYKFAFKKSPWLEYKSPKQYRQWVQLWNAVEDEYKHKNT